jgi:hypothetical protein
VLHLLGGPWDVAYQNGIRDFEHVPPSLPPLLRCRALRHLFRPERGAYATLLGDWIRWQIAGDRHAAETFVGPQCGLCVDPARTIKKRNIA